MTIKTTAKISKKQFSSFLNNPKKLLVQGGKFGIGGAFKMVGMILLFSIVNIILFFYAMVNGFESNKTMYFGIVILLGFLFTIIAGYKTYRYIIVNAFRGIYQHIQPFITKISASVVAKSEHLLNGKTNLKNSKNTKAIDIGSLLNEHYDKVPGFLKMGMTFIINRIPFVELLSDLKEDMDDENLDIASAKLNGKMDDYINESIFNENNTKWVYWLLPLNIIVQLGLIILK